jgi:DNA-binding IclR family transcriptional regulator
MPAQEQTPNDSNTTASKPTYEQLVRQVAERVWALWQQELRRDQERRGRPVKR